MSGQVRRLLVGEHHARVLAEVPDLGTDGWRRLTAEPSLTWRRVAAARPAAAATPLRRRRGKVEALPRPDPATPAPALLEATGTATGTASVARQRLAARVATRLRDAGLTAQVLGVAPAEPGPDPVAEESCWPAGAGVLIFGPGDQDEVNRRFGLAAAAWSLDPDEVPAPSVPSAGLARRNRERRAAVDSLAALCVLPLLAMAVPSLGAATDTRTWGLLLAAAVVGVAVPLLALQALAHRWPWLTEARSRGMVGAAALVVLLVLARAAVAVRVPPPLLAVLALLVAAACVPPVLRLLPEPPVRAAAVGVPVALALLAAPVGDLLDGGYLARLGLRPTDVALSLPQRWWSGAFFAATALAGLAVLAVGWGLLRQADVTGGRRLPPVPVLAVCGVVYAAAVLAFAWGTAWSQGAARPGELPGHWGGIDPAWVCWSATGGPADRVGFTGRRLPPTDVAVVWLGGAGGRAALWSPVSGGVTLDGPVQLRLRDAPGRCG
ncbi:MAG TPA: hypothetical protein VGH99_03790 [Pseudonocardia sp.]